MKSSMTIEESFVALCARSKPDERDSARIREAVKAPMDWEKVYLTALRSRTLPLLHQNIKKTPCRDSVPADVLQKFSDICVKNSKRNLLLFSYLIKLLNIFKESGILAIPFKGPVFTEDIYGDMGLRFCADLDILVRKEDARGACELLIHEGFTPEIFLNADQQKKYIDTEDNLTFFIDNPKITIELHWELSGNYLSNPFVFEDVLESLITVSIHQHEFPTFSPEAMLLYLCIHGAKHEWAALDWVCCVAELLRKQKALNWELIETSAKTRKAETMLRLGLRLAWEFLEAPIPPFILERIQGDNSVTKLSRELAVKMFRLPSGDAIHSQGNRFSTFHIRIRDCLGDKLQYFARLVFSPSKKEWAAFPLPASMASLHYLLRPCRLIMKSVLRS